MTVIWWGHRGQLGRDKSVRLGTARCLVQYTDGVQLAALQLTVNAYICTLT